MNGTIAAIAVTAVILIASVVAAVAQNSWGSSQQNGAQTYAAQQITAAESAASGS